MPIYTGKSKDGSDMHEVQGMYVSPDGNQWSSKPYQIHIEIYDHLYKYRRTLVEEYNLILSKKSLLPTRIRNYIINHINN